MNINYKNEIQEILNSLQPIKRKSNDTDYLCPSKWKRYGNENELVLSHYISDEPITENELKQITQEYNIDYMSLEYYIFLYLLNYHPISNSINIISTFISKYLITSNQEVTNIITFTINQMNSDVSIKELFIKYLFDSFSKPNGRRQELQEDILDHLLQLLYSSFPFYSHFITFLHQHNHHFLTKDQWICLFNFSHIVFFPQSQEFYVTYTSENNYFYPILFDEFFLYIKQLLLSHQLYL